MRPATRASIGLLVASMSLIGCAPDDSTAAPAAQGPTTSAPSPDAPARATIGPATPTTTLPTSTGPTTTLPSRPDWLGRRTLPTDTRGFGIADETPPELADRRFATVDTLPPPVGDTYESSIAALEGDPLARSTWHEGCPVAPEDLRYLTVSFRGFDGLAHTGELIVAARAADDVIEVFETMWRTGFPIEEMRIVTPEDLAAEPTGDGNNTAGFVCRTTTGGSAFSEHAHGLAIDVNPFHNPYVNGDLVLPELARTYVDRSDVRPGMLVSGDPVVGAFASIGWHWGGDWTTLRDWQHFSLTGR